MCARKFYIILHVRNVYIYVQTHFILLAQRTTHHHSVDLSLTFEASFRNLLPTVLS